MPLSPPILGAITIPFLTSSSVRTPKLGIVTRNIFRNPSYSFQAFNLLSSNLLPKNKIFCYTIQPFSSPLEFFSIKKRM